MGAMLIAMGLGENGCVKFETPEGEPIMINIDRVNIVRRVRSVDYACAVHFEKSHFVVVTGKTWML